MCPGCRAPLARCSCGRQGAQAAGDARAQAKVRVSRETKGHGGKAVTRVVGLPLDAIGLARLAGSLKSACGCGGSVQDGAVEIQGDQVERVIAWLQTDGWTVKRAGG